MATKNGAPYLVKRIAVAYAPTAYRPAGPKETMPPYPSIRFKAHPAKAIISISLIRLTEL
jgi:hypothetical protein